MTRPATERMTVAPDSAVPVSRDALTLVMPSPGVPESSAPRIVGAGGAAGAVVSIVSEKAGLAALTLPAASVAVAVTEYVPSARADVSWIV